MKWSSFVVAIVCFVAAQSPWAGATEPIVPPIGPHTVHGVWTAVPTDDAGLTWIVRMVLNRSGGGTLRIARGSGDVMTDMVINRVDAKNGRLRVEARATDKDDIWQSVSVDVVGRAAVADGTVSVRSDDAEELFRLPVRFVLHSDGIFLKNLRALIGQVTSTAASK